MLKNFASLNIAAVLAGCVFVSNGALARGDSLLSPVTVMTPNILDGSVGNSDWYMGWNPEYSVQVFVASSQLAALPVGAGIKGMSFRCSPRTATFPVSAVQMTRFDVTLSPSVFPPLGASNVFASNIGPGAVKVRSGPMTIPAQAFPAPATPDTPAINAWYVPFTSFYVYPGGDLCVTFRGKGPLLNPGLFDGYEFAPTAVGSAMYNYSSVDGVDGAPYGPIGIRFEFAGSTNCPGDLNFDYLVDDADFVIFLAAYNILDCADPTMPASCSSDLNHDGYVDDADFVIFLARYNALVCD